MKVRTADDGPPERSSSRPLILTISLAFLTIFSAVAFSGAAGGTILLPIQRFFLNWLGAGRYVFTLLLLGMTLSSFWTVLRKPPLTVTAWQCVGFLLFFFALLTFLAAEKGEPGGRLGCLLHEVLRRRLGEAGEMVGLIVGALAAAALIGKLSARPFFARAIAAARKKAMRRSVVPEAICEPEPWETTAEESVGRSAQELPTPVRETDKESEEDLEAKRYRNKYPPMNLLEPEMGFINREIDVTDTVQAIMTAMEELETPVEIVSHCVGPAIIQYQVRPSSRRGPGPESASRRIKVGDVAKVERDLAVQLGVTNLAIQAPVPGKSYIGIDLPNPAALTVRLRPLMESRTFREMKSKLRIALGRDITGKPVVVDLEQMPHLLIAGTTNSGKSICMRSIALCLLMNNSPEDLRVIMIDPKRVELFRFNGVPHLYGNVETEFERSLAVLNWAVFEMNERYKLFENEGNGVNKIEAHNQLALSRGEKPMARIVIFIDEVAEIMNGPDKSGVEAIDKLASLSRATGIHLILATQRPDTSVITGVIKNNIPARIALNVASGIDSRVIMGKQGAEKLLGRGDMYLVQPSQHTPLRIQGPMLMDSEIDAVVNFWRRLAPPPENADEMGAPWETIIAQQEDEELHDKVFRDAVKAVCTTGRATTNFLQTKFRISFPRAKRILSRMEDLGIVGPSQAGGKPREVLWSPDEADRLEEKIGVTEE